MIGHTSQEGIHLVLVKTPAKQHDAARSLAIQNYADEHGLYFLDFNEKSLYDEIGLDYKIDIGDDLGHGNLWGGHRR